jgi:hypothetical protein
MEWSRCQFYSLPFPTYIIQIFLYRCSTSPRIFLMNVPDIFYPDQISWQIFLPGVPVPLSWARIFKLFRGPRIDSKESIPPVQYVNPIPTRILAPIDCFKIPALNSLLHYDVVETALSRINFNPLTERESGRGRGRGRGSGRGRGKRKGRGRGRGTGPSL